METTYRISPSQINTFLNEPAVWILQKFYKIYGESGSAAKRGGAVEAGLDAVLFAGKSFEEAAQVALVNFDLNTEKLQCPKRDDQREIVKPMLEQAVQVFLDIGTEPKNSQIRCEGHIGDIPALGFADYDFGDYLIDLKTTERMPGGIETVSAEHKRQCAFYHKITGKPQKLAYVTPKKAAIYEVPKEALDLAWSEMLAASAAMKAAFNIEERYGVEQLARLYPPRDVYSFYWDEPTRNKAFELWYERKTA